MADAPQAPKEMTRRGLFRRMARGPAASATATGAVRLPWALPEAAFLEACDGCGLCATACAPGIVVLRRGFPEVDFRLDGCDFCGACVDACARGAFRAEARAAGLPGWTHVAAIGTGCLSANGTACRICGERCDMAAIRFRPALGGRAQPTVTTDCNGCGACVAACPVGVITIEDPS